MAAAQRRSYPPINPLLLSVPVGVAYHRALAARIDVRSVYRVGQSDVGTNARRVRTYLADVASQTT